MLREPPPRGSPRESLLLLYVLKKDHVEYAKFRALAQAMVNKEKGPEAFDEFRKTAFPWVETQQKRDRESHIKLLTDEIKKGSLSIKPLWEQTKSIRSRLKTRVVESESPSDGQRNSNVDMKKINARLGAVIPR